MRLSGRQLVMIHKSLLASSESCFQGREKERERVKLPLVRCTTIHIDSLDKRLGRVGLGVAKFGTVRFNDEHEREREGKGGRERERTH